VAFAVVPIDTGVSFLFLVCLRVVGCVAKTSVSKRLFNTIWTISKELNFVHLPL